MTAVGTLRKPFTLNELSEAISNLLSDAAKP